MAVIAAAGNPWLTRKHTFVQHSQHAVLAEALASCPLGHFVLLDGETWTGKSRSALEFCRHSRDRRPACEQPDGLHIYLLSDVATAKSLALQIYSSVRRTYPNQVTTKRAIESAVRALSDANPPIVVVEEVEKLSGASVAGDALAEIISATQLKFLLVGCTTSDRSPMHALNGSPNLANLRQKHITFSDFQIGDLALKAFLATFERALPVQKTGFFDDPQHVELIHALSNDGRIGEIARIFNAISEAACPGTIEIDVSLVRKAAAILDATRMTSLLGYFAHAN